MSIQASIAAAVLPIAAYLFLLRQSDRFEKESIINVLKHFFWGALGAVFLSLLGGKLYSYLLEFFIPKGNHLYFIESIYLAPVFEELSKAVFLIFTVRSRVIDYETDGLVYGGSIGLGFGMVENFFYFLLFGSNPQDWITLVMLRTLFSALMHTISTASFGAFVAKAIYSPRRYRIFYYTAGIILSISIHFIWNLSISFEFSYYLGLTYMALLISIFITYFLHQRSAERKIIIEELKQECDAGIIPYNHILILSSKLKDSKGWIKEEIRNEYVNSAIKLAFRKDQVKKMDRDVDFFKKEADFYRNRLIELLGSNE